MNTELSRESAIKALAAVYTEGATNSHGTCISVDLGTGIFSVQSIWSLGRGEMAVCTNVECWDDLGSMDSYDADLHAIAFVEELLDDAESQIQHQAKEAARAIAYAANAEKGE
jgi:hypothetical protein